VTFGANRKRERGALKISKLADLKIIVSLILAIKVEIDF